MKMKKVSSDNTNTTVNEMKKVIHHVTLLDASGSMKGGKYQSAVNGINEGFKALKNDTSGVSQTYTLVEFSGGGWNTIRSHDRHPFDTKYHSELTPIKDVKWSPMGAHGSTPLVNSTIEVINFMLTRKKDGEPVLLDIFTDGGETDHGDFNLLRDLIKRVETSNGFTITFRGTPGDVASIKMKLNLRDDNVLTHDNTARGIADTFTKTTQQKLRYTKSFASGASAGNLTQNFYSRTDEDAQRGL